MSLYYTDRQQAESDAEDFNVMGFVVSWEIDGDLIELTVEELS